MSNEIYEIECLLREALARLENLKKGESADELCIEHDDIARTAHLQALAIEQALKEKEPVKLQADREYALTDKELTDYIDNGGQYRVQYVSFMGHKYRVNKLDAMVDVLINLICRKYENGVGLLEHSFSLQRRLKPGMNNRLVISRDSGMILDSKYITSCKLYRSKSMDVIGSLLDLAGIVGEPADSIKIAFII